MPYPRVWRTDGAVSYSAPRRMVETRTLAGVVVLQRFGQPGLDLGDPSLRQRMGRQEFGLSRPPLGGHSHPEVPRRPGIVALARHVDQAEVIGLGFLLPAPRQQQADGGAGAEPCRDPLRSTRIAPRQGHLRRDEAALHRELLADALTAVSRDRMRDFVTE